MPTVLKTNNRLQEFKKPDRLPKAVVSAPVKQAKLDFDIPLGKNFSKKLKKLIIERERCVSNVARLEGTLETLGKSPQNMKTVGNNLRNQKLEIEKIDKKINSIVRN